MMALGIAAVFSVLTVTVSHDPWFVVLPIWLGIAVVIAAWSLRDGLRDLRKARGRLESALRRNEAKEVRIAASEMVELEEKEDEGACYVFQVDDDSVVVVSGQEFYASARFPNSDFSIATILDEAGNEVEMFIEKRGSRLKPSRVIPSEAATKLRRPDHLEVLNCHLENLESCLAV